jgi:hypothetical protein
MIAENFLRKKTSISFFAPRPRSCSLPSQKTVFPAGALLLCLILAKACGHSLAKPADKVLTIFIFQHETQNIQSFRQRNKTHMNRHVKRLVHQTLDNTKSAENFCCPPISLCLWENFKIHFPLFYFTP